MYRERMKPMNKFVRHVESTHFEFLSSSTLIY